MSIGAADEVAARRSSSGDSRKTKMALAIKPGAGERQRHVGEGLEAGGPEVAERQVPDPVDGGERGGGDPDRIDEAMRHVHQHDAKDGAIEADLVEQPCDVDVDWQVGKRLRQQEGEQHSPSAAASGGPAHSRREWRAPATPPR